MGNEIGEKVIKPPFKVTSGKIFKPSKAFLYKVWSKYIFASVMIWLNVVLGFLGISFLVAFSNPIKYPGSAHQHVDLATKPLDNSA